MATLDDKLLGEKLHYYCSSSEDEEGEDPAPPSGPAPDQGQQWDGGSGNTGPKGVIKDWQRYKQLEVEKREEAELEKLALAHKLSLTCRSEREEAEAKEKERQMEQEMEEMLGEEFMQSYMQKRMQEMMSMTQSDKKFGELIPLRSGEEFLTAVDGEEKSATVIVLLQEPGIEGCKPMIGCLTSLAREYKTVKFCQIPASTAGLSKHFKVSGVPALLVYRSGQLVSSFVRLTDHLGNDFFASDVESFLIEHSVLPDKEDVPKIIRGQVEDVSDSD